MSGADYSIPGSAHRPHDLVWIPVAALAPTTPGWARAMVADGAPVVVRRAARTAGRLPIGIRGHSRGRRHAGVVEGAHVSRCVTPESLAPSRSPRVPAIAIIAAVAELLDATGSAWGITGAVGFELATGISMAHQDSDLDLILRTPERPMRAQARQLHRALAKLPTRCDVQLETPLGGIALADWAGDAAQVLVKSDSGPFLARNPWAGDRGLSIAPCQTTTTGDG